MTKKIKILLVTCLAVLAAVCLGFVATTAFADSTRDYNSKYDKVFEDFDRGDISDTVTVADGNTAVDLGEKSYLHVDITEGQSTSADNAIYKHGYPFATGTLTIVLEVRSEDESIKLENLMLGIRGDDAWDVASLSFSQLVDGSGTSLSEITSEWTTLKIYLTQSFENMYYTYSGTDSGTGIAVSSQMVGIHIYATGGASGALDIRQIYVTSDQNDQTESARVMINDFVGGDTVDDTACEGTYWCGSSEGYIVRRALTLGEGGEVSVVNAEKSSEGYAYAVIEAGGDTSNLTVAATTDGSSFGETKAYSDPMELDGTVVGFKFSYTGNSSVTISRIFFTNYQESVPASAVPVINAETTSKLDDFNVAQSTIPSVYEDAAAASEMAYADLYYRISYSNSDKVRVEDGALVLDATALASDEYINFKTESQNVSKGYTYVVLKVKLTEGATLNGFRFALVNEGVEGPIVWSSALYSDVGILISAGEGNPYATEDGWYYLVVDMEESGLTVGDGSAYNGIDLYYSGSGIVYVDEIFFANEADPIERVTAIDLTLTVDNSGTAEYLYGGWIWAPDENTKYDVLVLTISAETDADISTMRFEFADTDVTLWFGENAQGTFADADGGALQTKLNAGESVTYYLDISSVGTFSGIHVHTSSASLVVISDVSYISHERASEAKTPGDTFELENFEGTFAPTASGYEYLGYVYAPNAAGEYTELVFTVTAETELDLSGIRLEVIDENGNTIGTYWFAENTEGTLYSVDGSALVTSLEAGDTVTFRIDISGIGAFNAFHIHSDGAETGEFTVSRAYLVAYRDYYKEAMEALPVYGTPDTVKPAITINNSATATAGEIEISYTVSDDVSSAENITVKVSVSDANGKDVAVTGNTFTAEEGVYFITVTAIDEAGNEANATLQITVSAAGTGEEDSSENGDEGKSKGCGSSIFGTWMGVVGALVVVGVLVAVVLVRRKKNGGRK